MVYLFFSFIKLTTAAEIQLVCCKRWVVITLTRLGYSDKWIMLLLTTTVFIGLGFILTLDMLKEV